MFNNPTNTVITGGSFNQFINSTTKGGFELLKEAVAYGAFHNSGERFDPPKCHENTRVAVIKRIMDWILRMDPETRDAVIMWLYGPAGAGKSPIAQTIAELLEKTNIPVSSFFFSRHDPMRGNGKLLVPTLVYQMTLALPPSFRQTVVQCIDHDPLIFTKTLETQFTTLVSNPLEELFQAGFSPKHPYVVVIDGLDECDNLQMQARIVDVAFKFQQWNHSIPLLFLISSRPEVGISSSFGFHSTAAQLSRLALDDTYLPDEDVRRYLLDQFAITKEVHPLRAYIPDAWPTDEVVNILVRKSSGQFIYASTVAKFVTFLRSRPTDRLDIVLGLRPAGKETPFADLDALYTHILSSVDDLETILKIVSLVVLRPPRDTYESLYHSSRHLESLLCLGAGDLDLLLQDLTSLVIIEPEGVRILHASLADFLFDQSRSKDLFVDCAKIHALGISLSLQYIRRSQILDSMILRRLWYHSSLAGPNPQLSKQILEFPFQTLLTVLYSSHLGDIVCMEMIGEYLNYLDSLTWDEMELFKRLQYQQFDQHLNSRLVEHYSDEDLLFLLEAILHRGITLDDAFSTPKLIRKLPSLELNFLMDFGQWFDGLKRFQDELIKFICNPDRSGELFFDRNKYSEVAVMVLKTRLCGPCYWSRIPPSPLSAFNAYTRRNLPYKWRKGLKKNDNIRSLLCDALKRKDFLDQISRDRWEEGNKRNKHTSDVFQAALISLPRYLENCQVSDELTCLVRTARFGPRVKEFPDKAREARRAMKQYLQRAETS